MEPETGTCHFGLGKSLTLRQPPGFGCHSTASTYIDQDAENLPDGALVRHQSAHGVKSRREMGRHVDGFAVLVDPIVEQVPELRPRLLLALRRDRGPGDGGAKLKVLDIWLNVMFHTSFFGKFAESSLNLAKHEAAVISSLGLNGLHLRGSPGKISNPS